MSDLLMQINPGLFIIAAGMLCALVPLHAVRKAVMIVAPIVAAYFLFQGYSSGTGLAGELTIAGIDLTTYRLDRLSLIWGYVFCFAGLLNGIFAFHEKAHISDASALIYTGAGLGAVMAGDLLTLFLFWELTAVSSVFLVWAGGPRAYGAGLRYLGMHVLSGVLLLAGAIMYQRYSGTFFFDGNEIGLGVPGGWLMLLGIGIKAGFPLLHTWIQDAYPKASVTGTVVLATFSTKMAIYALARGFAGEEILIYIGAIMTLFPVFFAVIENDLRKVLAYSLNNQLGFMVCGIGVGTAMAMNGVAGQVVLHVIFKALLFMSMGAVLHRVGTAKASELGGLFRTMPWTTVACLIGAASIAAFPLFAAFVTKAMIIAAVFEEHHYIVYLCLLFASAGVMEHSGIKVPYFAFFSHDSGKRPKEAPWNMLLAMGLASLFCIVLAWPWGGYQMLYNLMPDVAAAGEYVPYTVNHVITQLQLLFAAMFAFALLKRLKVYPPERRAQILDFDWFWRRPAVSVLKWLDVMGARVEAYGGHAVKRGVSGVQRKLFEIFSPAGAMSAEAPSGIASVLTAAILAAALALVYFVG